MLKMLVLYSQALLGSLLTMVVYILVLVAGVRLTDIGLFETYIYATPILALALPSMFGGGTVTNLALGFGASRRLCYWSLQLASLLMIGICLAVSWLTFYLSAGWMVHRASVSWTWGGTALLLCACEFALQPSILTCTMEKGWRRSLTVFAGWGPSFLLVMAVEVCLLLDGEPLFDVLRPLNILNPIWMTVGGIFLAGVLVLAIIARVRFNKLVVRQ